MLKNPLVFIPGLKGSKLANGLGKVYWCTGLQALGFFNESLALPTEIAGDRQATDDLVAGGPLDRVTVLPKIVEEAVYGPWIESFRDHPSFITLGYDWRRDNFENLEKIQIRLQNISRENGGVPLNVVAHSMGGMLTLALMNREPGLFNRVVFAGVPFHGGIGFLPDMHLGEPTGMNRKILSPRVLFTFPSVYSFFAEDREVTVNARGEAVRLDYFNVEHWKRNRLGIFSAGGVVSQKEENFLGWALDRGREFRRLMKFPPKKLLPSILVVTGGNFPTLDQVMIEGPRAVKGLDFKTCPKRPGDGRVARDNLPPPEVPFDHFISEKDHGNLLNDRRVQAKIREFLG